jgi:hypothetical protein
VIESITLVMTEGIEVSEFFKIKDIDAHKMSLGGARRRQMVAHFSSSPEGKCIWLGVIISLKVIGWVIQQRKSTSWGISITDLYFQGLANKVDSYVLLMY